jgi:hypothetical protein
MRLKDGAGAGGRERGVLNLVRGEVDAVRRKVGQFAVNLDGDGLVGVGGGVEQMDGAELLIDQTAGAGLEGLQVVAGVGNDLRDFLGGGVVADRA